ncbi:MAG: ribosome maturation factor RimP [Neisseriaceae bacterium]|nr:ribosome maturation factor RimP [Neisseriaceae bacterium]MBP6861301.1 ribosome maturation factor RimP [Neisseriaceae bacterium]
MDVRSILEKTLPGLGYELVDYELLPNGDMRIFIDKPGGITVEDCVTVSHHMSRLFVVEDVDYNRLEVSSPGLDRPLKKEADFIRFAGQLAKIKTRLPVDGQKKFEGRMVSFDEATQTLTLQTAENKTVQLELTNIDKARLKPEF